MTQENNLPEFATTAEAFEYLEQEVNDPCVDNYRFAFADEEQGAYQGKYNSGCCGFFDIRVKVSGRIANLGCNYGH